MDTEHEQRGGANRAAEGPDVTPLVPMLVNFGFGAAVGLWAVDLGYGLDFYPLTLALPIQAWLAAAAALAGPAMRPLRYGLSLASSYGLGTLWAGWLIGSTAIPGGDDGTGLRWVFLGGGACVVSYLVGLATLLWTVLVRRKRLATVKRMRWLWPLLPMVASPAVGLGAMLALVVGQGVVQGLLR